MIPRISSVSKATLVTIWVLLALPACSGQESPDQEAVPESVPTYTLRFIFEGAIGFHADWENSAPPLWVLVPSALPEVRDHPARILVNSRHVDKGNTTLELRRERHNLVYADLDRQQVQIEGAITSRILTMPSEYYSSAHPPSPPDDYLRVKKQYQWLASVTKMKKLEGKQVERDFLIDTAPVPADKAKRLDARLKFEVGNVYAFRLEGDTLPEDTDPSRLTKFEIQYRGRPRPEPFRYARANSIAVDVDVSGPVRLAVTRFDRANESPKYIALKVDGGNQLVEIFVENLPLNPRPMKPGNVRHFNLLYTLLDGIETIPPGWNVPRVRARLATESPEAGDEACPPGCFGCR